MSDHSLENARQFAQWQAAVEEAGEVPAILIAVRLDHGQPHMGLYWPDHYPLTDAAALLESAAKLILVKADQ